MDPKQAVKLGFVLKLASEGYGTTELLAAGEKLAAKSRPVNVSTTNPLAAAGVAGVGLGYFIPSMVGTSAGSILGQLMASEYDTLRQAKKRYIIRRMRQLVDAERERASNRLLSEVKGKKLNKKQEKEQPDGVEQPFSGQ